MSNEQAVVQVMDQRVTTASTLVARSALAHVDAVEIDNGAVLCREQAVSGLLVLRADASTREDLSSALEQNLSIGLPERLQSLTSTSGHCIRWMSPDEWLLSCSLDETYPLEQRLRKAVSGHFAIVNVSGGFTTLVLSGPEVAGVLSRSTSYNINPEHFVSGMVVNTLLAKAPVTLRALDAGYEIIVRRSLADYLFLWLQRAGREQGLQVTSAR